MPPRFCGDAKNTCRRLFALKFKAGICRKDSIFQTITDNLRSQRMPTARFPTLGFGDFFDHFPFIGQGACDGLLPIFLGQRLEHGVGADFCKLLDGQGDGAFGAELLVGAGVT